jgi:hypothetical protein
MPRFEKGKMLELQFRATESKIVSGFFSRWMNFDG